MRVSVVILRLIATLLVILAAFYPYFSAKTSSTVIPVLLDVSDSMSEEYGELLLAEVRALGITPDIIPFAEEPATTGVSELRSYRALRALISQRNGTNIEKALAVASGGDVILLSDGRDTAGELSTLPAATRIFPIVRKLKEDSRCQFERVDLQTLVTLPGDLALSTVVNNPASCKGMLVVALNNKTIYEESVKQTQSIPLRELVPGINEVQLSHPNIGTRRYFVSAITAPQLLLVGSKEDNQPLKQLLARQGVKVVTAVNNESPQNLQLFGGVIINNTPYDKLPLVIRKELPTWVDSGGTAVFLGGDQSFGIGGYIGSNLEKIIPVKLLPPTTEKKRLNVAVSLVLDKSRSMATGDRLEYVKEAARAVANNLKPEDYIGVIGYDSAPFVVVKLGQIGLIRAQALDRIGRLFPAGRTNLLPALDEARRSLVTQPAGRKHIIILTDGKIPDAGELYYTLVRELTREGVTVSTVLLGSDTDDRFLQQLARVGSGSFYRVVSPSQLSNIFIKDIEVATGERTLVEQELLISRDKTLDWTDLVAFPPLLGAVETARKPTAIVELLAGRLPLLAFEVIGNGKSVAFTSDLFARWSRPWFAWNNIEIFIRDLFGAVLPKAGLYGRKFKWDTIIKDGRAKLTLSLEEEIPGEEISFIQDASKQSLIKTAPGRYELELDSAAAGDISGVLKVGGAQGVPIRFIVPGKEQQGGAINAPLLFELARKSGGKVNPDKAELKVELRHTAVQKTLIAPYFLAAALIVFLLEILLRVRARVTVHIKHKPNQIS